MTRNWNDLPNEMKWMIVDRMDIITRFRLKMCSKSDKCLVETVPFYCDNVCVGDDNPNSRLLRDFRTPYFHVGWNWYTETLSIKRGHSERFIPVSSEKESREMIKCMFRAFMLPQNVRIGQFYTSMNLNYLFPSSDFKLHANLLGLNIENREENEKWLNALAKQPEHMVIWKECNGIGTHPMVKNLQSLQVLGKNDIDDDQLMRLKVSKMTIMHSIVTDNGINRLIKKMIDEDYPDDSHIQLNLIEPVNWDRVIEGLDAVPDSHPYPTYIAARVTLSSDKVLDIFYYTFPSPIVLITINSGCFPPSPMFYLSYVGCFTFQ